MGERGLLQAFPRGDRRGALLLVVTAVMVTYGTVMVASASSAQAALNGGTTFSITIRDVIYLFFGLMALWVMARIRLSALVRVAPLLMMIGLGLLAAVMVAGVTVDGAKRWLPTPFIQIQPSEFFKLVTVIYVAWAIQKAHDRIGHWQHLVLWLAPVLVGVGLIVLEHDLGTTSVVAAIAVVVLFVAGVTRRQLAAIVALAIGGALVYGQVAKYSAERFMSFLHPNSNLAGAGYQLLQSKIGLGAGGVMGLGYGHSREKWGLLPNPHTDFIFSIIGEELGLIGTLAVIGLFVWFLCCATSIARHCTNEVYRLVVIGITTWIVLEALINIASVVGFWAVTGVPLPFFSYGGTALITELAAVGLLYNIAHDRSTSKPLRLAAAHAPYFERRTPVVSRSSGAPARAAGPSTRRAPSAPPAGRPRPSTAPRRVAPPGQTRTRATRPAGAPVLRPGQRPASRPPRP